MARRSRKPPRNPVARYLAIVGLTALVALGGSALLGWDRVLDFTAKPLLMTSAATVVAYTAVAIRLGWIATVGYVGQVFHYERAREPILFWMLVVLYLGMAIPTACYMAVLLVRGGPY